MLKERVLLNDTSKCRRFDRILKRIHTRFVDVTHKSQLACTEYFESTLGDMYTRCTRLSLARATVAGPAILTVEILVEDQPRAK